MACANTSIQLHRCRINTKLAPQVPRRPARIANAARQRCIGADPASKLRITDTKSSYAVSRNRPVLTPTSIKSKANDKATNQTCTRAETPAVQRSYPSPPSTSHNITNGITSATDAPFEDATQLMLVPRRGSQCVRTGKQHIINSCTRGALAGNAETDIGRALESLSWSWNRTGQGHWVSGAQGSAWR